MSTDTGDDRALESALDDFLDWAQEAHVPVPPGGLPDAERVAGIGPGTRLGDFALVRRLDAGGMGVVYEARQLSAGGRRVAVKVLRNLFGSARLEERFRREVEIIGAFTHESIVPVVGAGVEGGTAYYAMPFLDGLSASRLVRALRVDGQVPEHASEVRDTLAHILAAEPEGSAWACSYMHWVAACGRRLGEALQYAQDRGVTHRDVKPGNVMIGLDGRAVLLDFGLAHRDDEDSMTGSHDFVGTLAYASPEQVRGAAVDQRTDVYGLGAALYELLALRRAFDAPSEAELRHSIVHERPPKLGPWIPIALRTIVGCALEKNPARRYASPGDMARDLAAFSENRAIAARPPGYARRIVRRARRYPRAIGAVLVLLLIAGALALRDRQRADSSVDLGRALLAEVEVVHADWLLLRDRLRAQDASPLQPLGATARELDELQRAMRAARTRVDESLRDAERGLLDAFAHVDAYGPARAALADLYAAELSYALEESADLLDRARVDRLHAAIEHFGGARAHRDLLDRRGYVDLASRPTGATFEIWSSTGFAGEALRRGRTPMRLDGLAEGSYLAVLERPGHVTTRYPFVVRRAACDELDVGPGPPRELNVELMPETELLDGFVPIPGGWTLVHDDPPRWEFVETFQMRRFELRYDEYLEWLCASDVRPLESKDKPDFLPRYGDQLDSAQVAWVEESGTYVPVDETQLDWPVRGLLPTEMQELCAHFGLVQPLPGADWYGSLPTRAEWLRAARGADARAYPWGDTFEWSNCRGHLSSPNPDREPWPSRVGLHPDDESPFQVRDLAGSLAEAVLDRFGFLRDEGTACGGSYRGQTPAEMRTTAIRRLRNRPETDVGVRVVVRRLPEELRARDLPPADFVDDFERPDGATVGNGWFEAIGPLPDGIGISARQERCWLERGRLKVFTESGNNPLPVEAWHALALAPGDWAARIELRTSFEDRQPERSVRVELAGSMLEPHEQRCWASLTASGLLVLRGPDGELAKVATTLRSETEGVLELRSETGRLEARAWSLDEGPDQATWVSVAAGTSGPPRFLGICAASLVGSRVAVERLEVRNR